MRKKNRGGVAESAEFMVNEPSRKKFVKKKRSRMHDEKLKAQKIGNFDLN